MSPLSPGKHEAITILMSTPIDTVDSSNIFARKLSKTAVRYTILSR